MKPMFVPAHGLWDGVYITKDAEKPTPWPDKPLRFFGLLLCPHYFTVPYTRTDRRPGPGFMSDSYEGDACRVCKRILSEKKVY